MSKALTRAELEDRDKEELVDLVLEFQERFDQQLEEFEERVEKRFEEVTEHAALDRAKIRARITEEVDRLEEELDHDHSDLHKQRAKLTRRVASLENEVGMPSADPLNDQYDEVGKVELTKLGRLVRLGPEAISENPTSTMRRAKVIAENLHRWGNKGRKGGVKQVRLSAKRDDLKTRLEDEREERLAWKQVYRAMEKVEEWSDGSIQYKEGSNGEGKHVLVYNDAEDGQ